MGKYDHLQTEFEQGFISRKWKSLRQFAIAKGIDPNSNLKRVGKNWVKKAELLIDEVPKVAKNKAKEKFIERATKEWEVIYKNLGEASSIMSEKIRAYADQTDFTYIDSNDEVRLDSKAIKALIDAGISTIALHKKTYIKEEIPLAADIKQKVEEAKLTKESDKPQDTSTAIQDRIDQKMKEHGIN